MNPNSYTTLLSSKTVSYSNGASQPSAHRYAFNITNAVKGWKLGNYMQSKGLLFKAPASVENGSTYIKKTFSSYNRSTYKPSLTVNYDVGESQGIANGTYYLNGKEGGGYLRYASGAASAKSGLISSLGNSIRWELQSVDGGYVLRSRSDMTKYLAVPSSTASTSVTVETVSESALPSRCIWTISVASGGCFVKSAYNGKYLYSYGTVLNTTSTLGTSGTSTYNARVWRIITQTNMVGRELTANFRIDTCYLFSGETVPINIIPSPQSAVWATASDFTYSGYSIHYVSLNGLTGKFTANTTAYTSATVTATHKVTDRTATFTLVVNPRAALVGVTNAGHDHSSALSNSQTNLLNCGYSAANIYTGAFTNAQLDTYLDTDTNNVFVSRSHGHSNVNSNGRVTETMIFLGDGAGAPVYSSSGSINNLELSNMKLVMFIACHTGDGGEGGANLPTVAVEQGAETAVGFTGSIGCEDANEWIEAFFTLMQQDGMTVEEACARLAEDAFKDTEMVNYVICGNGNATLG